MTLVIARKNIDGQVILSSDSRISFSDSEYIDYGVKIFRISTKIYSPTDHETKQQKLVYDQTLGLAITGSAVNAYTVKEILVEMLQNLQYAPGYTDFSLEGIAKLIRKVLSMTNTDLGAIMNKRGLSQLILSGYCPNTLNIRTFKFEFDYTSYPVKTDYKEILSDPGVEFFGSGKTEAELLYKENNSLSPYHIIKRVIKEAKVPTVGGGIQAGEFENNNFKILGIEDYSVDESGYFEDYLLTLRGITLYKNEFETGMDEFHISNTFLQPFEKDIDDLIKKKNNDRANGIIPLI